MVTVPSVDPGSRFHFHAHPSIVPDVGPPHRALPMTTPRAPVAMDASIFRSWHTVPMRRKLRIRPDAPGDTSPSWSFGIRVWGRRCVWLGIGGAAGGSIGYAVLEWLEAFGR